MRGRRITIQRLSKCGFMLCFVKNPAVRSRENFVLCLANIVLCLDIIMLCFHKLNLCCVWLIPCCVWKNVCCVPGIYCVLRNVCCVCRYGPPFLDLILVRDWWPSERRSHERTKGFSESPKSIFRDDFLYSF